MASPYQIQYRVKGKVKKWRAYMDVTYMYDIKRIRKQLERDPDVQTRVVSTATGKVVRIG